MQCDIHYAETRQLQIMREPFGEPRAAAVNAGEHGALGTVLCRTELVAIGGANLVEQRAIKRFGVNGTHDGRKVRLDIAEG